MNQFLYTLDDSPVIHASPLPGPVILYCDTDPTRHACYSSEGPSVTCPDCRAHLYELWATAIEHAGPGFKIELTDDRGGALLEIKQVQEHFILFTATREDGYPSECYYRTERVIGMLIASRATIRVDE